jgi:hypothetical protein
MLIGADMKNPQFRRLVEGIVGATMAAIGEQSEKPKLEGKDIEIKHLQGQIDKQSSDIGRYIEMIQGRNVVMERNGIHATDKHCWCNPSSELRDH